MYNFIVLSNQPFDTELKTNKYHVSKRLAQLGNKVIFVSPPLRFKALKNFLKNPSLDIRKLFFNTDIKNPNLIVYNPANIFNFWPFSWINTCAHTSKLNEISTKFFDKESRTILYAYHFDFPDLENFIEKIPHDLLIYDCVDEYTAFPEYAEGKKNNPSVIAFIQRIDDWLKVKTIQKGLKGKAWVMHREEWLTKKSDIVMASAPELVEKLSKWKENVHYLPNGAESEIFDIDATKIDDPDDMKYIPHPRIGFIGSIDTYKNDISLIENSAQTYPDYQFILIGPEKVNDSDLDLTKLKSMKNVHFLGRKNWEDTPKYFNKFDAFFIPYNYDLVGCFPVKYFESLSAGLPTVVTGLPGLFDFDVDGYVSKTKQDFVSNIKKAIEENSSEKIKRRKKIAHENTWNGKVHKQLHIIGEFLEGRK